MQNGNAIGLHLYIAYGTCILRVYLFNIIIYSAVLLQYPQQNNAIANVSNGIRTLLE